ncbi:hypothetical protein ACMBCN_01880, partial [Candidatus Liberibacter asiaticus]|nr:hypothetical protein [Candidatus Liberibacter asiaticus]
QRRRRRQSRWLLVTPIKWWRNFDGCAGHSIAMKIEEEEEEEEEEEALKSRRTKMFFKFKEREGIASHWPVCLFGQFIPRKRCRNYKLTAFMAILFYSILFFFR